MKEILTQIKKWITKENKYSYSWKATGGDNPEKKGLDKKLLNKKEGYEVVSLIASVFEEGGWELTKERVLIVETDIHESPFRSREDHKNSIILLHSDWDPSFDEE